MLEAFRYYGWPIMKQVITKKFKIAMPLLKHMMLHICFWFILHAFLSLYLYLGFVFLVSTLETDVSVDIGHIFAYAMFLSLFHGFVLGIIDYFFDKLLFVTRSIGRIVVLHLIVSLLVFFITFLIVREYTSAMFSAESSFSESTWRYLFYVLFVQYTFGSLLVALSHQTFRKYGRDVFVPLLLGLYRQPREQNKLFMFLDLKASTSAAEKLGHATYSRMVQQFMIDVNKCLNDYGGNIYQYVGDEVIVTWNTSRKNALLCLRFFFACQKAILKKEEEYKERYRMIPTFKAGIDCGIVTAVEIGDMKRDIAYHGDTVNTASRIQNLCNTVGKNMLMSAGVFQLLDSRADFEVQHLGCFHLKGKEQIIELYSAEEIVDEEG